MRSYGQKAVCLFVSVLVMLGMALQTGPVHAADEEVMVSNGMNFNSHTTNDEIEANWGAGVATIEETEGTYTVTLHKSITITHATLPISFGNFDEGEGQPMMVLDLNGCTVTSNSNVIANYGNLTIQDSKGTGLVLYNGGAYLCAVNNVGYQMIIDGGKFECQGADSASYNSAISSAANTKTVIHDGVFEGNGAGALITYGEVEIHGGKFDGKYGVVSKKGGDGEGEITFTEGSSAVISADSMAFVVHGDGTKDGKINVLGGTFHAPKVAGKLGDAVAENDIAITGGIYDVSPTDFVPTDASVANYVSATSAKTLYAVGNDDIAAVATQAEDNALIDIMQGSVELNGLDYVKVQNSGGGTVTVNGIAIADIPVEVHNLEVVDGRQPDCTVDGWNRYYMCTGADGKVFEDADAQNEIIDLEEWKINAGRLQATGHSYEWVIDKEATATEKGNKHEECTVCGDRKATVEIPATGTTGQSKPTEATNPTGIPDTGDNSGVVPWMILLVLAGAGLAYATLCNQKKRERK